MKKLLTAICFLGAFLLSGADLLDETAGIVDILERDYWLSQQNSSGDYRNLTEARIKKLVNNINRIQRQLNAKGKGRIADLTGPAMTLSGNYGSVRTETIRRFKLSGFKKTSMDQYSREFKQWWKEKEAAKNSEEEPAPAAKGKKSRPKRRRNVTPPKPTLANVDLIEYERWLAEICSTNVEKFQTVKHNGNRSENNRMSDAVREYFTAIRKIRIGLAKVRQVTQIEFK